MGIKAEHWKEVSRIFNEAINKDVSERSNYVAAACSDDPVLKADVQALLSGHESFDSFIDSPAVGLAAGHPSEKRNKLSPGDSIGLFRILSFIGAGGMGEVYLAEDERLDRHVALKLLPEDLRENPALMSRFRQEARAASALSHPNIITVFEVDFSEEHPFIATEFIEGETLRRKLASDSMSLETKIEIAAQIASALSAAHRTGIVHRDVKPENIMLRREDGLVKILDFGLAKPTGKLLADHDGSETLANTAPGAVFGTFSYMSPEQAKGEATGPATDIWSFGVVLYEMLAGRKPFEGSTPSHTIVKILDEEPSKIDDNIPAELREVLSRALEKNPGDRFPSFEPIVAALEKVRHEISFNEYHPDQLPTSKTYAKWLWTMILLVGIVAVAFVVYWYGTKTGPAKSFEKASLTRLTTSGKERLAALSPDGKYLAHVSEQSGRQSLSLRQVSSAVSREVIPAEATTYVGLVFSPDGENLFYTVKPDQKTAGILYRVPVLGGEVRRVLEGVESQITFSPDGSRFAFYRSNGGQNETSLLVTNSDGSGEPVVLASRKLPDFLYGSPVWSPDGKTIACPESSLTANVTYKVTGFNIENKEAFVLTNKPWTMIQDIVWLRDNSGFLMSASESQGRPLQIWRVLSDNGEAKRLTNDVDNYFTVGSATKNDSLVAVRQEQRANLWLAEVSKSNEIIAEESSVRQITTDNSGMDGVGGMAQTPDGLVIFSSTATEADSVWVMNANGLERRQLLAEKGTFIGISTSDDGRFLVYALKETDSINLWITDIVNGSRQQIPKDPTAKFQFFPYISPDGNWILYIGVLESGAFTLRKVNRTGAAPPTELTDYSVGLPKFSPDGKMIAFNFRANAQDAAWQLGAIPAEGGEVRSFQVFGNPSTPHEWTQDSKGLMTVVSENGVSNLWRYALDGGRGAKVTNFTKDTIFNFDLSPDGKRLILSRGTINSDVVLLSDSAE